MLMIFRDFLFLVSDFGGVLEVVGYWGEICRWRGRGQRLRRMMDDGRWGFSGSVTISEPGLTNCSCRREAVRHRGTRGTRQRGTRGTRGTEAQGEH
jgi:hypothetical protein